MYLHAVFTVCCNVLYCVLNCSLFNTRAAHGLKVAAQLVSPEGQMEKLRAGRYASWQTPIGQRIESGKMTLEELERAALDSRKGAKMFLPLKRRE